MHTELHIRLGPTGTDHFSPNGVSTLAKKLEGGGDLVSADFVHDALMLFSSHGR
jgi:hypothetical protein